MATLLAPAHASAHVHAARRLHFSVSSDGLLHWLSEECSGRGLIRLGELLDDLLTERQADQPEPPDDPELEALLPFCWLGATAPLSVDIAWPCVSPGGSSGCNRSDGKPCPSGPWWEDLQGRPPEGRPRRFHG